MFAVFSVTLKGLLTPGNIVSLAQNVSILGVLEIGVALTIIGRGVNCRWRPTSRSPGVWAPLRQYGSAAARRHSPRLRTFPAGHRAHRRRYAGPQILGQDHHSSERVDAPELRRLFPQVNVGNVIKFNENGEVLDCLGDKKGVDIRC